VIAGSVDVFFLKREIIDFRFVVMAGDAVLVEKYPLIRRRWGAGDLSLGILGQGCYGCFWRWAFYGLRLPRQRAVASHAGEERNASPTECFVPRFPQQP